MDFFKTIGNIYSSAKNFLGLGGGQAAIGPMTSVNRPPDTVEVPFIGGGSQYNISSQTGASTPAFIGTTPKSGFEYYNPSDIGQGGIIKPGAKPISSQYPDLTSNIRPLITTQPTQPVQSPQPVYYAPGTSGPQPRSPEAEAAFQAQEQAKKQGLVGQAGVSSNQQFQQVPSQQEVPGVGGFGGTGAGASLAGAVGGVGAQSLGTSQEEQGKKKQPQFTMITAQQAQDAAKQGLLQGSGQSGVFKDQQGNFYGISNAQVANTFTPNAQGRLDITQNAPTTPFQTSLATNPISAEALLNQGKGTGNIIPTGDILQKNLQTVIDTSLQNQPPLPQQPVVETRDQQQFVQNSADPYGLQVAMDQSRVKNGLPDLENQRIQVMKNAQALQDGIQKIVKDINENPEFPKGLAARMISDFTNKNGILLQNLQGQLQIINTQIDQANEAVNREYGIKKFGVEKQITTQEQQRDNTKNLVSQFISSKAIANMDDATLQHYATAGGYTLSSLKAIRDAIKAKAADITNVSYKENAAGDVTVIGLDANNKPTTLGTIKGVGTPSIIDKEFTRIKAIVAMHPGEWGKAADQIDRELGKGTATKYDDYLKGVYQKRMTTSNINQQTLTDLQYDIQVNTQTLPQLYALYPELSPASIQNIYYNQ